MPYTDQEKRNILLNAGYDPSKYFFHEPTSSAMPIESAPVQQSQPTQPPTSVEQPKPDSTIGEAFKLGFEREILPASTGLMTGLTAFAATGGPVNPWVSIPAMLLAGFGGGAAAQYGQNKLIIPQDVQQRMALAEKEHPYSTFGGQLTADLLTANPIRSIKNIGSVAKKLPDILRANALSDAERAILGNAAMNTAIAAGSEGYGQYQRGEFDPLALIGRSAAYGLLGNEPNFLGRAIGMHGTLGETPRPGVDLPIERMPPTPSRGYNPEVTTFGERPETTITPEGDVRYGLPTEPNPNVQNVPFVRKGYYGSINRGAAPKSAAESARVMIEAEQQRQREFELAKEEIRIKDMELAAKERELIERQMNLNQIPGETTLGHVNPQKTYMKGMERSNLEAEKPLTPAEQIELQHERNLYGRKFQEGETTLGEIPQEILQQQESAAKRRGFNIQYTQKPIGGSGAGVIDLEARTIKKSAEKQGLDTTPHEGLGHGFVNDLLQSKDPKDRALGKAALELFKSKSYGEGKDAELVTKLRSKGFNDRQVAEEMLATTLGKENWKRMLNEKPGLKQWWEDVKANFKNKFGMASEDEILRHLNARYHYDAPYGTRSELMPVSTGENIKPVSQEGEPEKPWNHWLYKEGAKDIPDNWRITVQEDAVENGKVIAPGYVQIDKVDAEGRNTESTSIEQLRQEGYDVPDYDKILRQGTYNAGEINDKIRKTHWQEGEPIIKEKGNYGPEIQKKLTEASFKAGTQNIKVHDEANANAKLEAEREGRQAKFPVVTEATKEADERYLNKINETEAFTRPDVERHQEAEPDRSLSSHGFVRSWEGAIDKVRKVNKKEGPIVAEAIDNFTVKREGYEGIARNVPYSKILGLKLSEAEKSNVFEYLRAKEYGDKLPTLNAKEQKAADITTSSWNDIKALIAKEGVDIRYSHDMLNDEAIRLFSEHQGSPEFNAKINEWANYVEKRQDIPFEEAKKAIKSYINSLGGGKLYASEYNALKEVLGYQIPDGLRENNIEKVILKYGRRVAQDVAYWKALQSQPDVAAALSLPKREGGIAEQEGITSIASNSTVKNLMKFVFNDFETIRAHPRINALARIFVNSKLGAATGLRDVLSIPVFSTPYVETLKDVKAYWNAFGNLQDAKVESLKAGVRRPTMDLDRWQSLDSLDSMTGIFNKIAEAMRKYQGREHLEQAGRIYTFALGKEMAKGKIIDASRGDKNASAWLEKFSSGIDEADVKKWGPEELNQVAANFTTRVQGSYDARGLPSGAFDSQFAPLFALQRWSIEKSNVIYKDVFMPMKKGNFKPFLLYTLGSVLTGTAIRELNQVLSGGKKDYTPSVSESVDQDRKDYLAASVANLMQMASYAGIMSDFVKGAADIGIQKEMPRNPITFPMADFLTQDLAGGLLGVKQAIDDGADPADVAIGFAWEVIAKQVQNLRLADQQMEPKDIERKNKYRDMRIFNKLSGENVPPLEMSREKEIVESPEKKFKRTSDIEEAASELPKALDAALKKSEGDPFKLKAELRSLKINSYQTMPDPNTQPLKFYQYITFLEKTQGAEKASERLQDWIMQREINKVKSEMVPAL